MSTPPHPTPPRGRPTAGASDRRDLPPTHRAPGASSGGGGPGPLTLNPNPPRGTGRLAVQSHYFQAQLPRQFDLVVHLDTTSALRPVGRRCPGRGGKGGGEALLRPCGCACHGAGPATLQQCWRRRAQPVAAGLRPAAGLLGGGGRWHRLTGTQHVSRVLGTPPRTLSLLQAAGPHVSWVLTPLSLLQAAGPHGRLAGRRGGVGGRPRDLPLRGLKCGSLPSPSQARPSPPGSKRGSLPSPSQARLLSLPFPPSSWLFPSRV